MRLLLVAGGCCCDRQKIAKMAHGACRPQPSAIAFNLRRSPPTPPTPIKPSSAPAAARPIGTHAPSGSNKSTASLIDDSDPPNYTLHQAFAHILLEELGFRDRDILVLGAGGFRCRTASRRTATPMSTSTRRSAIAEEHFLREPARGEFIADDARRFVAASERRFDAVVVDVYKLAPSIPSHLVTREFWAGAPILKPTASCSPT